MVHAQKHIRECDAANDCKQLYRTGGVIQEMFYTARHFKLCFDKVDGVDRTRDSAGRLQLLYVYLSKASVEEYDAFPMEKFQTFVEKRAVIVSGSGSHAVKLLKSSFETWLGLRGLHFTRSSRPDTKPCTLVQIALRPRTRSLVKFHKADPEADNTAPAATHWLFRTSLPDGSLYAADFASVQFVDTPEPMHYHGIMPWEDYLRVLGLEDGTIIEAHDALEPVQAPYGEHEIQQLIRQTKLTSIEQLDQLTDVTITIGLNMSLQNLLIHQFFIKLKMPTKCLVEILNSFGRHFAHFVKVVRGHFRTFLFHWCLVLRSRKDEHGDYLQTTWKLLKAALRVTSMTAEDFDWGQSADKPVGHDTPQQSV